MIEIVSENNSKIGYQCFVKYLFTSPLVIDSEEEYVGPIKHLTEKAAQSDLGNIISRMTAPSVSAHYKIIEQGIRKIELPGEIILEGEVGDNGLAYEDYTLTIGDARVEPPIEELKGRKVRLIIQLLE